MEHALAKTVIDGNRVLSSKCLTTCHRTSVNFGTSSWSNLLLCNVGLNQLTIRYQIIALILY